MEWIGLSSAQSLLIFKQKDVYTMKPKFKINFILLLIFLSWLPDHMADAQSPKDLLGKLGEILE